MCLHYGVNRRALLCGFRKANEITRKCFPLQLSTNEMLKISEKSILIRSQRPKWRQSNRKEKINYDIVEPWITTRYKFCSKSMKRLISILDKRAITQLTTELWIITNLSRPDSQNLGFDASTVFGWKATMVSKVTVLAKYR